MASEQANHSISQRSVIHYVSCCWLACEPKRPFGFVGQVWVADVTQLASALEWSEINTTPRFKTITLETQRPNGDCYPATPN